MSLETLNRKQKKLDLLSRARKIELEKAEIDVAEKLRSKRAAVDVLEKLKADYDRFLNAHERLRRQTVSFDPVQYSAFVENSGHIEEMLIEAEQELKERQKIYLKSVEILEKKLAESKISEEATNTVREKIHREVLRLEYLDCSSENSFKRAL